MHIVHITPAILLALASVSSARPAANATANAYDAILEGSPAALARALKDNKVFLTKDNSCGNVGAGKENGWTCDPMKAMGGACCSSDGWCGNGPKYCEARCQPNFGHCEKGFDKLPKPVTKCGPENKNQKCNNGECCSANGFCGTNRNFCGIGCMDKFGKCAAKPEPKPKPAPKPVEHLCGHANKNQKCPGLDCCSHAGFCGIGTEFCAVPQNCQRGFGRCDSDMFPNGASTLKDPRPQLGKNEYGKYIMDCKVPGTVAMTFDDGPNVYTSELLDKLKAAGAKATFMVGGNNNGRQIDQGNVWSGLLKRMIAEGHQVASHTWSHPHMNTIRSEDRKLEMAKTERAIANIIGKYPTYMRPPYSECDEKSGCQNDMKDMGYSLVGVPFDTLDWKNAAGQIQDSVKHVEEFFDKLNSESHLIVCQHDFLGASVQELTPVILEQIEKKGLRAVTLGECLGDDIANWYRVPGKGTSWVGHKVTLVDAITDEPLPEHPEPEHSEEESHGGEKRYLNGAFGPQADGPPMLHATSTPSRTGTTLTLSSTDVPWFTIAPVNPEIESRQVKRQLLPVPISPPLTTRNHGGIETDHEMEDVDMDIARTEPKLPTFPSSSELHTREGGQMPSEIEMGHALDEMVGRLMSPEEIAADTEAKESPEDTKDVEAAAHECVLKLGNFCGRIQHFFTKYGCFESAKRCYRQVGKCTQDKDAKELEDGCGNWDQICSEEVLFCRSCGGKGYPECKSKNFKPQKAQGVE